MKRTTIIKPKDMKKDWYLINAKGLRLGRLATFVATILQGKNKPSYTSFLDSGDNVVIINAKEIDVNENRLTKKLYFRHSGYPQGDKTITMSQMMDQDPSKIVKDAIWGMMPKTKLGRAMMDKLYIYIDDKHKQEAQQPKLIEVS